MIWLYFCIENQANDFIKILMLVVSIKERIKQEK